MPSTSKKQHNFMAAVANNPSFSKKVGVPQSVGQEFTKADTGRTFKQGGSMMKQGKPMMGAAMRAPAKRAPAAPMAPAMPAGMGMGMKHGGKTHEDHHHHMKMAHHHLKMAMKMGGKTMEKGEAHSKDMGEKMLKHGGKTAKFAKGGSVPGQYALGEPMSKVKAGGIKKHGEHAIQERGHTRALQETMKGNTIGNGPIINAKKRGGRIC